MSQQDIARLQLCLQVQLQMMDGIDMDTSLGVRFVPRSWVREHGTGKNFEYAQFFGIAPM